jgi:predicted nucleotidyltransferase
MIKKLGINDIILPNKDAIIAAFESNNIDSFFLFGSVARGEADNTSDVDFLLMQRGQISDQALIALKRKLTLILSKKIDLVILQELNSTIIKTIIKERVDIKKI